MRDIVIWRENIFDLIPEFGGWKELRRGWSGNGKPGEARSFNEDVAVLLDDYEFREFVAMGPEKVGSSDELYEALLRFRDAFDQFWEKLSPEERTWAPPERVLSDPLWARVVEAAAGFARLARADGK